MSTARPVFDRGPILYRPLESRANEEEPMTSFDQTSIVERSTLRRAAMWFLAASVGWWVAAAALIPREDFFVGEDARAEAISIARNAGMFRGFHLLAVLATAAGAVGAVLVSRALRAERSSRLARAGAGLAIVGLAAWIVEASMRVTIAVTRAREVVAATRAPGAEPAVASWAVLAIAALGFIAPAVCTWALARARVPAGRGIVLVAVFTTLVTLAAIATLAPSLVYQFAVPTLALFVLFRTRHLTTPQPAAVAGD
jgi:hypothetical protein